MNAARPEPDESRCEYCATWRSFSGANDDARKSSELAPVISLYEIDRICMSCGAHEVLHVRNASAPAQLPWLCPSCAQEK